MPERRIINPIQLPDDVLRLSLLFHEAGHKLFIVGGAVRDAVMGLSPKDFDLATDAQPDRVLEILRANGNWSTDEVGKSFGVIRARRESNDTYEIATFRQDIGAGRRPDSVVFSTIEEDVKRRDLTINALFYDIASEEIIDLVGGFNDIASRVIRTVGDPKERFAEDRLRVLRALRFASRFDFSLSDETKVAILEDNNLDGVSPERIREEFLKCIRSAKKVDEMLYTMAYFEMWERILPGFNVHVGGFQTRDHVVLLALLLGGHSPSLVTDGLHALKYTTNEVAQITFLLRLNNFNEDSAYRMRLAANRCGITEGRMLKYAFRTHSIEFDLLDAFCAYRTTVKGDDVLAAGFSGPEVGKEIERRETQLFRELVTR